MPSKEFWHNALKNIFLLTIFSLRHVSSHSIFWTKIAEEMRTDCVLILTHFIYIHVQNIHFGVLASEFEAQQEEQQQENAARGFPAVPQEEEESKQLGIFLWWRLGMRG